MRKAMFSKAMCFYALVLLPAILARVSAAPARDKLAGDWLLSGELDGRQMTSILSLAQDTDGKCFGRWISFWGATELNKVHYDGSQLNFTRTSRYRDRDMTTFCRIGQARKAVRNPVGRSGRVHG